ncbi:hypothetical protein Syun_023620 [Stephania yunnanensis]|uniref:Uncharacterized protein n=1 Tax=Stephania yunnanensis TaxID=152371 RepID=A0AAP0I3V1_9MAGN
MSSASSSTAVPSFQQPSTISSMYILVDDRMRREGRHDLSTICRHKEKFHPGSPMLSAVIRSALSYPAFTVGTITGTPEVRPSRSSRTRERSSRCSNAHTEYGPNRLTTFEPGSHIALMGEQPQPLERTHAPRVAKSRHRGAKPSRRCELWGRSLLSLE